MKKIIKHTLYFMAAAIILAACDKVAGLPHFDNGMAPTVSSNTMTLAPAPADSLDTVLTISWSSPHYATDSSSVKYVIEMDSSGRDFSNAFMREVSGALKTSFTAKELNDMLLAWGFDFNVAYPVDLRVISSYANNNEQYRSGTVTITMTPYKVPPKVQPPASGTLFLVGSATNGGWDNPVPVPTQQFAQLDSVTYGGVFDLTGGNQYLILPVNGNWDHKYAVADNTISGLSEGGDFGADLSDNFPGPANSGKYAILVDFQHGTFKVTPYTATFPDSLYIVGDATAGGWDNPVPVPGQQFTRMNSCVWSITLPLTGGGQYLFLPVNGNWDHKFAVDDNTLPGLAAGGSFGYDLSKNFPGPSADGTYTIDANFLNYQFKVTQQ